MNTLTVDALIVNEYRQLRTDAAEPDLYLPIVLSNEDRAWIQARVGHHLSTFPDERWAITCAVEDYEEREFDRWLKRVAG